jgi:hypothetical protein
MPGRIYLRQFIYRSDLILNPNVLFVFGDNMLHKGLGGQAREMRGQPNAIGIPTKQSPGTATHDYFINSDLQNARIRGEINSAFKKLRQQLLDNKDIVFPKSGIGTGLSQLETRAPEILRYIELHIRYLYEITENTHHFSQNPIKDLP